MNPDLVPQAQTALMRATSLEATIATAIEAQMRATIQARYALAIRNPRDTDMVRQKLLKECKRPGFAAAARYAKPQGKVKNERGQWVENFVVGLSIRFAEAALRAYGNVLDEQTVIHDDENRRVMRVSATDLECNLTYSDDVVIVKTVERSSGNGREVISTRLNSYDKTVYVVVATDDEVLQKQSSLISKALRKQVLRMIPRDLQDECMEQIETTMGAEDKADPDAQRKKLFDAFATFGVSPAAIKEYLGHEVGLEDLATLRAIFQALKQGEAKWADLVSEKQTDDDAPAGGLLVDKLKATAAKKAKPVETPRATEAPAATDEQMNQYIAALHETDTLATLDEAWTKVKALPMSAEQMQALTRNYMGLCQKHRAHQGQ